MRSQAWDNSLWRSCYLQAYTWHADCWHEWTPLMFSCKLPKRSRRMNILLLYKATYKMTLKFWYNPSRSIHLSQKQSFKNAWISLLICGKTPSYAIHLARRAARGTFLTKSSKCSCKDAVHNRKMECLPRYLMSDDSTSIIDLYSGSRFWIERSVLLLTKNICYYNASEW